MHIKTYAGGIAALALSTLAYGAGYQVIEQGASNIGTAMAGATANANNDASAAFWNPAAASFMDLENGQTRLDATISGVIPTLEFRDKGTTGPYMGSNPKGSCGTDEVVPNFYAVHKFTDNLAGTLSITAPYGLESNYNSDWVGRMEGLRSYLFTSDFNPSLAYKVTDWLSVSGGLSAQFAYCTLTQYTPLGNLDLAGDSWGIGGNIGIAVQYAEDGRFGFSWRSAVKHTLKGNSHLNDSVIAPISADMSMPDTFTMGIYQRLRGDFKELAVMMEYAYTRWSVFDELYVEGTGQPAIPENWEDTSRVGVGFHYYPDWLENTTLRIGSSYDQSPVPSAQDRTVRIPCSDRIWLSCGLGYKFGQYSIDLAYSYIFVVDSEIDRYEQSVHTTVDGEYFAHIHVISLQFGFVF